MAVCPVRFATSTLSSEPPPVPIAATFSTGTNLIVVTFDRLLAPGTSGTGNWVGVTFSSPAHRFITPFAPLVAAGSVVSGTMIVQATPTGGPPRITYNATPPEVFGTTGMPVAPFADFPLTLIP